MSHASKSRPSVKELADEVFNLVQFDQGKAFISDGIEAAPSPRVVTHRIK